MIHRLIITIVGVATFFCGSALAAQKQPNIFFILADDLGGRDVGCYGSTFHQTPNIDALAKRGMLFRNAYSASPLCSPRARASSRG